MLDSRFAVVLAEAPECVSAEYRTLPEAIAHARQDSEFGVKLPNGKVYSGYEGLNALERRGYIGPRGAVYPSGSQAKNHGEAHNWTREIYGVRYGFVFVHTPDGARSWFVQKWVPREVEGARLLGKWVRHRESYWFADGTTLTKRF